MSKQETYRKRLPLLLITAALLAEGYSGAGDVVAAGYQLPVAVTAAPGQVLTILVQGINAPPERVSAGMASWPATLAGISVTLTAETQTGTRALAVPLNNVFPFSNCVTAPGGGSSSCGTLTGVTLQAPFEMLGPSPSQRLSAPVPDGVLTISDQGGHVATISVIPISDQIHVVRSLDTIVGGQGGGGVAAVVHADGSYVSADSPAKTGETLSIYAVGLGITVPSVMSGAPSPAVTLSTAQQTFRLHYDFQPNSAPSPGLSDDSRLGTLPTPGPLFVGLTPGFVGLYQVNFVVIGPPQGTFPCGGSVSSNFTITLVGPASFDGADICVDTSGL